MCIYWIQWTSQNVSRRIWRLWKWTWFLSQCQPWPPGRASTFKDTWNVYKEPGRKIQYKSSFMKIVRIRDGHADADRMLIRNMSRIYRAISDICRIKQISASMRIGKYIRMAIPSLSWTHSSHPTCFQARQGRGTETRSGFRWSLCKSSGWALFWNYIHFFPWPCFLSLYMHRPWIRSTGADTIWKTNHVGRLEKTCLVQKHGQTRALENANKHVYYISPKEYDKV